jgi:hypothetical protein
MFRNKLLTPKFDQLVAGYLATYSVLNNKQGRDKIRSFQAMLIHDPMTRFCIEVTLLYMFSMLGEYRHSKTKIQKDVQNNISNCEGSWREILKRMSSVFWYGYSWSEVAVTDTSTNRKILSAIQTLNPVKYDFDFSNGKQKVVYYGEKDLELDFNTGIHLVVGTDINFDYLLGCGRAEAAIAFMEFQEVMLPVLAIAGQRQATPILVKKTDSGRDVILVNPQTGIPEIDPNTGKQIKIKNGWESIRQLEELGSAGVTVIDLEDDLFQIEPKIAEKFLMDLMKYLEQNRMLSFLVPATLGSFSGSGVGDSSLADVHLETFEMMVFSMLEFLCEQLIEQLFRPIIIYNHGVQDDYGYFEINMKNKQSLEIAKIVIDAIAKGKGAFNDLETINKVRELLDIPLLTELPTLETPVEPKVEESPDTSE